MKKEWKDKWVAALESDQYKRGKHALKRNNKFCCLGVLCDLVMKEHPEFQWIDHEPSDIDDGTASIRGPEGEVLYAETLPEAIKEIVGMNTDDGTYNPDKQSLAFRNDNGTTFKRIANIIEKNWETL